MAGDIAPLMALRVQGLSSPERIGAALAIAADDAVERLRRLVEADLARERTGRLSGFTLTPSGVAALDELLAAEGLRASEHLNEGYERFLLIDPKVKKISTEWQERGDELVIDRLCDLHARARRCLDRIVDAAARYAPYSARLDACVDRLQAGDHSAFTKPAVESYHQVWWELHTDLLLTLGRQRED